MEAELADKIALVTGAGSPTGIGFATARILGREGAAVAVTSTTDRIHERAAELHRDGVRAEGFVADLTDRAEARAMVDAVLASFGRIDVLVNNAGVGTAVPATRETPEQFRAVVEVNLLGSYWMAQACGRVMKPGSSIVNVGSVLGSTSGGLPQAAYASSKAGIVGLTRDLAQQWTGRKGIRVNALAPGFFETEMTEAYPPGYLERVIERVPAGRIGQGRELAAAAVFLASDEAAYITGVLLPVDGGLLTG
jgi:NAD(P)-dependent dehydrogenase (short-subunit alcohol dehydrogenase family)